MAARPDLPPERCVFINCPYDAEFAPLFDGIIFATVCCGFVPRSATESGLSRHELAGAFTRAQRVADSLTRARD